MKKTLFCAGILVLAYLIGACTRVGHIQRTEPVRMMTFPASHTAVAQCVQQRLGAKLHNESFDRLVIYNSMKGRQAEGLTHYSITIGKAGEKGGFAEWRVVTPATSHAPGPAPLPKVELSDAVVQEIWKPVQDCAAQMKTP
jgi:hypothetical protein